MPTTMKALITALREDRLDEKDAAQWQDDELRRWINEGTRDICRRIEILPTSADIAVSAGVQQYTMATDVLRVNRVEWRPTGQTNVYSLEYRDFNNMDSVWWTSQIQTQGTPVLFTMWGYTPNLKLVLYPTPSVSGVAKVFYYKLPTEIATDGSADTSTIDLPEGWHDLVLDYAEYRALRKDGDDRWQAAKAEYEQHLINMEEHTRRISDQAGMIVAGNTMIPQWLYGEDVWY